MVTESETLGFEEEWADCVQAEVPEASGDLGDRTAGEARTEHLP